MPPNSSQGGRGAQGSGLARLVMILFPLVALLTILSRGGMGSTDSTADAKAVVFQATGTTSPPQQAAVKEDEEIQKQHVSGSARSEEAEERSSAPEATLPLGKNKETAAAVDPSCELPKAEDGRPEGNDLIEIFSSLEAELSREVEEKRAQNPPADETKQHLDSIIKLLRPNAPGCAKAFRSVLKPALAATSAAQKSSVSSISPCPGNAPDSELRVFIDLGSRTIDQTSNFMTHYPSANKYVVHAMEANPKFNPLYPPFIRKHAGPGLGLAEMHYHNNAAGVENGTLWLSNRDVGSSVVRDKKKNSAGGGGGDTKRPSDSVAVQVVGFAEFVYNVVGLRLKRMAGLGQCRPKSHVVVKMDIEKMEFAVLHQLLRTGVFSLIDDLLLECHYNTNKPKSQRDPSIHIGKDDCVALVSEFNKFFSSEGGEAEVAPFTAVLWNSVKTAKSSGYSRTHGGFFPT